MTVISINIILIRNFINIYTKYERCMGTFMYYFVYKLHVMVLQYINRDNLSTTCIMGLWRHTVTSLQNNDNIK